MWYQGLAVSLYLIRYVSAAPNVVLITHLPTANQESRDQVRYHERKNRRRLKLGKLIDAMTTVSKHAFEAEPGVLKYALLIPHDDFNDTSMYSIEE